MNKWFRDPYQWRLIGQTYSCELATDLISRGYDAAPVTNLKDLAKHINLKYEISEHLRKQTFIKGWEIRIDWPYDHFEIHFQTADELAYFKLKYFK